MLNWKSLEWNEFENTLRRYKLKFYDGKPAEEKAYLQIRSLIARAEPRTTHKYTLGIVNFLNAWHCRFQRANSVEIISQWIQDHYDQLENFDNVGIVDNAVIAKLNEAQSLYESVLGLRSNSPMSIHNMSDACASQILHILSPEYFVMWDKMIMNHSWGSYDEFIGRMHEFGRRLLKQAPAEAQVDVGKYLSTLLHYPARKSFAKFLDEYNWFTVEGSGRTQY